MYTAAVAVLLTLLNAVDGDLDELQRVVASIQNSNSSSRTAALPISDILSDFKDAHKRSAIHFAALRGRRKVIAYILEHSPASRDALDEDGRSPLLYAVQANEFSTVKMLLVDYGASPQVAALNGTSCLHEAAAIGSVRLCTLLVAHGAHVEAATANGTPLHIAVSEGQEKTVKCLVSELEANVNARNAHGITPLLLATLMHKVEMVRILLDAGADMAVEMPHLPGTYDDDNDDDNGGGGRKEYRHRTMNNNNNMMMMMMMTFLI